MPVLPSRLTRWILIELSLIYLLVQIYIWRWQSRWPGTVWLILLLLLASHLWHRDTFRNLGFRTDNFLIAFREACWAAIPLLLLLVLIGILSERLWSIPIHWQSTVAVLRYTLWGTFQQYGLQGYFHNRLSRVVSQPLWSSAINSALFMSFHFRIRFSWLSLWSGALHAPCSFFNRATFSSWVSFTVPLGCYSPTSFQGSGFPICESAQDTSARIGEVQAQHCNCVKERLHLSILGYTDWHLLGEGCLTSEEQ